MRRRRLLLLAVLGAAIATPALAHVGQHPESGLAAGFAHPFTGIDHLLAMLAVGLWAGLAAPRHAWVWPAAFVAFMLTGFTAGVGHGPLGWIETAILASVVGLGGAAALELKLPLGPGAVLVALFALVHGYAHGQEAPADANGASFAAGFVLASASLHLAGLAGAWAVRRIGEPRLGRAAGLGVALGGLALAWLG